MLNRLLEWMDHADPGTSLVMRARIRSQHVAGLAGLIIGIPYALFFQFMGVRWSVPVLVPIACVIFSGMALFTRRGRPDVGAQVLSWGAFSFISIALLARGGMFSNAAAWLLVAPFWALVLGGPRLGSQTSLATVAVYVGQWLAPELGVPWPAGFPPEVLRWMPLVDYPLIVALMGGLLAVQSGLWKRAEQEALDAAKARSIFLATMSHEIRTPLNGVLGLTEVLLGTPMSDEQRTLASTIQRSGTLLRSVLDDVLDYSKIDAGHLEAEALPVDLEVLGRDLVRLWEGTARERGLELRFELSPDVPRWVSADANKLRQIIGNLISNALKFTQHGGVVLGVKSEGETLQFTVRDTGIGMTPAQMQRIFEPFVQGDASTTRRFGGTGLGLSICRRLARFLGGDITVSSVPDQGSTFLVTLPLVRVVQPALETVEAPKVVQLRGLRVLVAEDNAVNQLVICRLLGRLGVQVQTANDGEACIEQWKRTGADLIFMDCQMPKCDGYEATRRIRSEGGTLPIIALTANAMAGDREQCLAAGMNDYLGKPIEFSALAQMLERWTQRAEAAPRSLGNG